MGILGNPWGKAYTLISEDGERVTLQGMDYGVNLQTPESQSGWNLIHVEEVTDEPDAFIFRGQKFRPAAD